MKKILSLVLCAVVSVFLCGCSGTNVFSAKSAGYTATALGFDQSGSKIKVFLEAVIVNSEDSEADVKLELLSGEGKTVKSAMEQIYRKAAQPIMLSHIGVAVAGKEISDSYFEEIRQFCYGIDKITLSMLWVTAESAQRLLSCEPISSVAVGYDIMSMLKEQTSRTGIKFKNRFYEIEALAAKPLNITALPYFAVGDGSFYYSGVRLYENAVPKMRLTSEETGLYAIATNSQNSGQLFLNGKNHKIDSAYSTFDFSDGIEKVKLSIDLDTKQKTDIKKGIESLFIKAQKKDIDIFAIGNNIYRKEPKKWKKIKNEYEEKFKSFELTVEMK